MGDKSIITASKTLTYILRHGAEKEKLVIRADGFISVKDLLLRPKLSKMQMDIPMLLNIVQNDAKGRFNIGYLDETGSIVIISDINSLQNDQNKLNKLYICAAQGHTIKKVDNLTDKKMALISSEMDVKTIKSISEEIMQNNPVHGSFFSNWKSILKDGGLRTMGRNHIHITSKLPKQFQFIFNKNTNILSKSNFVDNEIVSGMRSNCNLLFFIDIEKSALNGISYWKSTNDVLLTTGTDDNNLLPLSDIKQVIHITDRKKQQFIVLMEYGTLL